MKVILEIPDEEIKEQLKENAYVVEGEGEKGSVDIAMLYTNGTLDFICVEGREHFVRLKYKTLPDNATNRDVMRAMFNEVKNGKQKKYYGIDRCCEDCIMGWDSYSYEGECEDCGCCFNYEFDVPIWKCALPDWVKKIIKKMKVRDKKWINIVFAPNVVQK